MITVHATVDKKGCIGALNSNGHAEGMPVGHNIACATVTALVRTAARLLCESAELGIRGSALRRGELGFRLQRIPMSKREYVRGISSFLLRGISDIADEYPQQVHLQLDERWTGLKREKGGIYGT